MAVEPYFGNGAACLQKPSVTLLTGGATAKLYSLQRVRLGKPQLIEVLQLKL